MNRDAPHKTISGKHRYIAIFLVLILFSSSMFFGIKVRSDESLASSEIICQIFFEPPELFDISIKNRDFTYVKMQNCISFAEKGKPALPVYSAQILIPYDREIFTVEVTVENIVLISDDLGKKPVTPQQESLPFSVKKDTTPFFMDENIYELSKPVIDDVFSVGEIGVCRGYNILTVFLYPVIYIPKEGLLYYIPDMTIVVTINDESAFIPTLYDSLYRGLESDKKIVTSLVENPEYIKSYDDNIFLSTNHDSFEFSGGLCDTADSYKYVIITNNALRDTKNYSYNWSDLITHRQSYSNLSGTIVTVEDIDSCTDYWDDIDVHNDTQAHIRQFCKDAYEDWETEYILLGGDWDSSESNKIVPYREFTDVFETETYDSMACDLYYSHLNGNWYYSSENVWGGGKNSGKNDLYGELYVGRITASNAEDVSNAVSKIINYDTNASLSTDWLRSVSFWGGNLGWTSTSKQYMEEIRLGTDTHRNFTGFEEWNYNFTSQQFNTSEQLYHEDLGSNYKTYFSNSVEDDNASIINHLDHSSWNSPMGLIEWISRYNTKPFLGYSQGCLAGRYQEGDAGCERLICNYPERHAYALILNTGYGYGSGSTTDGASQYIMSYFWDYFFNNQSENQENWQLGKAMNYAKGKIATLIDSNSHAWCYAWYSAHFFGDPSQTLRITSVNEPVHQSNPYPNNESINISLNCSLLSIDLFDPNNDNINWTIETSPQIGNNSGNNEINGTKTCNITNLTLNTTYYWYVNATDGNIWTRACYTFNTNFNESESINTPPVLSNLNPTNNSNNVPIYINSINLTIEDPNGDFFNWTIETNPNIGNNSGDNDSNGSKSCIISAVNFNETYYWFVNVSDGYNWSNNTYQFTTRMKYNPIIPSNFNANSNGRYQLDISWDKGDNADYTYIEWNTSSSTWDKGSGIMIYNGTEISTSDPNLSPETTIYYQAWSYNSTDNNYSILYASCNATTDGNNAPDLNIQNPTNGSTYEDISFTCNVQITDREGDTFNWSIECNNGQSSNENDANNGTKQLFLNNLSYETTYYIWVNTSDSYDWTRDWYTFTTMSDPEINNAPTISTANPENGSISISISLPSLSVTIEDIDNDVFNWSIETSPNIGSNTGNNDSNGIKTCSLLNMDYSTTYYWFVNVSDGNYSVNNYYHFRTTSAPLINPPKGGFSIEPKNIGPIANAGDPYIGFVNETIILDGSNSSDIDGTIVSYTWDFGDGNSGNGQITNHTYYNPGNYTIILTVTDNDDDTDTDTTIVTINEFLSNTGDLPSTNSELSTGEEENADADKDGIPNIIEEELGSDTLDDSDVEQFTLRGTTHYFVDTNEDGYLDVFYNSKSGINSQLKYINTNKFLIDIDGDGEWDYTYNLALHSLNSYSTVPESENLLTFLFKPSMIFAYVIIILSACVIYLLRNRISLYLIKRSLAHKNPQVHFFSESENEEDDDNKPTRNFESIREDYEETQDEFEVISDLDDKEISENSFSIENIEETIEDVQKYYENKFEEEIEIAKDEKINSIFNLPKQDLENMSINLIHEKIDLREIQSHVYQILENKEKAKQNLCDIDSVVDTILNSKLLDNNED
jgi:hypothetical protein